MRVAALFVIPARFQMTHLIGRETRSAQRFLPLDAEAIKIGSLGLMVAGSNSGPLVVQLYAQLVSP